MRASLDAGDWIAAGAAVVAVAAAIFSGVQVYYARDAEHRALRAYVAPAGLRMFNYSEQGPKADVSFKNSGQTPASNLVVQYRVYLANHTGDGLYSNTTAIMKVYGRGSVIAHDDTRFWAIDNYEVAVPPIAQLVADGKDLVFDGAAEYDDVFGDHHKAEFCFVYMKDRLSLYKEEAAYENKADAHECNNNAVND